MDLSQYRKIIIYGLTFFAYAWSGYGANILQNLRDAVLSAESVFENFFENAITVAKKMKDIHEMFNAAVEEECIFQCLEGKSSSIYDSLFFVKDNLVLFLLFNQMEERFFIEVLSNLFILCS